jgi:MEDS: MEthanogen/methylotroph, DcmR Sensory domain
MKDVKDRRIGVPGIGTAPWGEHICVFFNTKEELLSLVVPYIKAGLEDNEFCMWITGDPVAEREAFQALEAVVPQLHHYLAQKQLEIMPSQQWYLPSGEFDAQIVLDNWVSRARHAETKGFAGIRITGNPVWLKSEEDWSQFGRFEETVHERIRSERVVALCTYPLGICQGRSIQKTLSSHNSAFILESDQWRRLELSPR